MEAYALIPVRITHVSVLGWAEVPFQLRNGQVKAWRRANSDFLGLAEGRICGCEYVPKAGRCANRYAIESPAERRRYPCVNLGDSGPGGPVLNRTAGLSETSTNIEKVGDC